MAAWTGTQSSKSKWLFGSVEQFDEVAMRKVVVNCMQISGVAYPLNKGAACGGNDDLFLSPSAAKQLLYT